MSVDQSFNSCGWVITNDNKVVGFGTIQSVKTETIYRRALDIALALSELCTQFNIVEVRLEGIAFGTRGNVTRDLSGLQFVVITTLMLLNSISNIRVIAPTQIKKVATQSGKATKSEMIAALPGDIHKRFVAAGFKKTTGLADLADAYWISQV